MLSLELIALIGLALLAWLWFDSIQARDIGIRAAKAACEVENIQLLDATVSIASVRLARDEDGQLALRRAYHFDYSDTGNNRRRGSLIMLGHEVLVVNIGLRLMVEGGTLH